MESLFENDEEAVEVSPDIGAPVTESEQWGIKEKAFEPLVVDEEEKEINKQKEKRKKKGKDQQMYVSGKR